MKERRLPRGIFIAKTDIGRVRVTNEDRSFAGVNAAGNVLLCVCDGMGGQNKGDYASKTALDIVVDAFRAKTRFLSVYDGRYWLSRVIRKANAAIYDIGYRNPMYHDMGTTLVIALFINEEILIASIGDSRAYMVRYGSLKQLTEDETYVDYLYRTGKIKKEEMKTRIDRHVLTNAIGMFPSLSFFIRSVSNTGSAVLLCSDGLYNNATEEEIHAILTANEHPEQKIDTLIAVANANGGSDNIAIAYWEEEKNDGQDR